VTPFTALWLPILVSLVVVFVLSSAIHMASPWHKSDYPKLSNEDAVMDALRPFDLPPGDYMFPRPSSMAEMKSPEFLAKVNRGPKAIVTVLPNGYAGMAKNLVGWAIFILVVTLIAAHLASVLLPVGAHSHAVFHTIGLYTLAAYAFALWPLSIWYGRGWGISIKSTVDGFIYAIATALIFMWMWPH
jgi:hypothetical protein